MDINIAIFRAQITHLPPPIQNVIAQSVPMQRFAKTSRLVERRASIQISIVSTNSLIYLTSYEDEMGDVGKYGTRVETPSGKLHCAATQASDEIGLRTI